MLKKMLSLALLTCLMVAPALADAPPKGFSNHKFNGSIDPVTKDGVTTFHIEDEDCSSVDFGDGRGESDCSNGSVRSMFGYDTWAQLGQSLEYRFDVLMPANLEYEGYFNKDAAGFEPDSWDSNLRLATWEGTFLHNFIYILKASKKTGLTFAGVQCQAPEDFGKWVSFSMKVKWTGDDKGWIAVTCDDKYIYAAEAAPTNVAPACYVQNQCVPGEVRSPKKLLFIAGAQLAGWGGSYKDIGKDSAFVPIQDGGISVQMRNMAVTRDPVLYGPTEKALVMQLQEALNGLGCDVGTADGVPGKRTREAALSCRKFADGAMPAALNVATVGTFVTLYTADGVSDLPPGEVPREPLAIHAFQQGSETSGEDKYVAADFSGKVTGDPSGVTDLNFLLTGEFDYATNRFEWLSVIMMDDLKGNTAVSDCQGIRIEDWGDGGTHAVIEFDAKQFKYIAQDMGCIADKMPEKTARKAAFIVDHFAELAKSLVTDGTIEGVSNDGLKMFLRRVANGEIAIAGVR